MAVPHTAVALTDSTGAPLEDALIEVGTIPQGGYAPGGYLVDLSARFAEIHSFHVYPEGAASWTVPFVVQLDFVTDGPGKVRIYLLSLRYDKPDPNTDNKDPLSGAGTTPHFHTLSYVSTTLTKVDAAINFPPFRYTAIGRAIVTP